MQVVTVCLLIHLRLVAFFRPLVCKTGSLHTPVTFKAVFMLCNRTLLGLGACSHSAHPFLPLCSSLWAWFLSGSEEQMWPVIKSGTSLACILQCLSALRSGAGFRKHSLPTDFMHLIIASQAWNCACASCKRSQCQSRQRHTSYKLRKTVL